MKEYIHNLRQRFRDTAHLAAFMGVSVQTIRSWQHGRRTPRGAELRMLQVLGVLATEAPWLLASLAGTIAAPSRSAKPAPEMPKLEPVPFVYPKRDDEHERQLWRVEMRRRWDAGELDDHIGTLNDDEYDRYRISVWGQLN